jgi:DNA mismatch repair ATPase MutL
VEEEKKRKEKEEEKKKRNRREEEENRKKEEEKTKKEKEEKKREEEEERKKKEKTKKEKEEKREEEEEEEQKQKQQQQHQHQQQQQNIVHQLMHFCKMYFITYGLSPKCFRCTRKHHQGVSKNNDKTYNKLLICTGETIYVMVNTTGTPCCNIMLVYISLKQIQCQLLLKTGKTGCICVVACSSHARLSKSTGLYLRNETKHTHRDGFTLKLVIL